MTLTFGSVCSGIEAASVAWHPLGWRAAWFAEVDKAASLAASMPEQTLPNHGDMTLLADRVRRREIVAPDVLVGGTPCQAFSVAGLRGGLQDARGQLTLAFVLLADAIDEVRAADGLPPVIIVWENVPGVLNHKDNPFGCFLGGIVGETVPLVAPGKRWTNAGVVCGPERAAAWRTLDAQFFGLAQRRRRVFVVASARAGFDPAAILLEFDGVRRDSAPRREKGEGLTHPTAPCLVSSGRGVERTGDTRGQDPVVAVRLGRGMDVSKLPDGQSGAIECIGSEDVLVVPHGGVGLRPADAGCVAAYANAGEFGGLKAVDVGDPLRAKGGDVGNGAETLVYCMAHGQAGAEVSVGARPTLTCNHEAPIALYAVHGTQDPCVSETTAFCLGRNSGGENVIAFSTKDHGQDAAQDCSPTLRAMQGDHANGGGQVGVAYAIQERAVCENPNAGPDGIGVRADDCAYTLEAQTVLQAVAVLPFDTTQVTSAYTYSKPDYGGPCHPLAAGAHPSAVCITGDITHTLKAEGFDASEDGTGRGQPIVPCGFQSSQSGVRINDTAGTLDANYGSRRHNGVLTEMAVRRLMPIECERLQGFPDNWTLVPTGKRLAADGPRYKQCGNSMAVPVMAWIGRRIAAALPGNNGGPPLDDFEALL